MNIMEGVIIMQVMTPMMMTLMMQAMTNNYSTKSMAFRGYKTQWEWCNCNHDDHSAGLISSGVHQVFMLYYTNFMAKQSEGRYCLSAKLVGHAGGAWMEALGPSASLNNASIQHGIYAVTPLRRQLWIKLSKSPESMPVSICKDQQIMELCNASHRGPDRSESR